QLRGDAGVVGARNPERRIALHASAANHEIFQGDEHGMAHMQLTGHVRRGNGDDKWFGIVGAGFGAEPAVFFPPMVKPFFSYLKVVSFRHFGHCCFSPSLLSGKTKNSLILSGHPARTREPISAVPPCFLHPIIASWVQAL